MVGGSSDGESVQVDELDMHVALRGRPGPTFQGLWFADLDAAAALDLDGLQPVPVLGSCTQFQSWEEAVLLVGEKRGL